MTRARLIAVYEVGNPLEQHLRLVSGHDNSSGIFHIARGRRHPYGQLSLTTRNIDMNTTFPEALRLVLKNEGGFVNHPKDPGGATNLGITIGTAKRYGVDMDGDGDTDIVDIKKLTVPAASKIYKGEYWDKVAGDLLPAGLDYAVFDFAVNSGVSRAAKYLQAIVGASQDGAIGQKTLALVATRDATYLIGALCDRRLSFLKSLDTWSTFGTGWGNRVAGVRASAIKMAGV